MEPGGKGAYERLLAEIKTEFPRFRLIPKHRSPFQKAIHRTLWCLTFGKMTSYMDSYVTTLGQRVYVHSDWDSRCEISRCIVLRHERIHMRQFRRFTFPGMALLYIFLPLPAGLAYFRARFELEAYAESIRASAEFYGADYVRDPFYRNDILEQFTGPSYGWMWPFRSYLERWYDRQLERIS